MRICIGLRGDLQVNKMCWQSGEETEMRWRMNAFTLLLVCVRREPSREHSMTNWSQQQ